MTRPAIVTGWLLLAALFFAIVVPCETSERSKNGSTGSSTSGAAAPPSPASPNKHEKPVPGSDSTSASFFPTDFVSNPVMNTAMLALSDSLFLEDPEEGDGHHGGGISSNNKENQTEEFDDRTLLDLFGEAAKDYLTNRVIPDTDIECRWDWRFARCEPVCNCELQPKWGDYHLGRACRLRTSSQDSEEHFLMSPDECERFAELIPIPIWLTYIKMARNQARNRTKILLKQSKVRMRRFKEHCHEQKCQEGPWRDKLLCGNYFVQPACSSNEERGNFTLWPSFFDSVSK